MDTLESRTEMGRDGNFVPHTTPILWRGKSAKEVHAERYSDLDLKKSEIPLVKSTRAGIDYCRQFTIRPHSKSEEQFRVIQPGDVYATLTEIDPL